MKVYFKSHLICKEIVWMWFDRAGWPRMPV